MASCEDNAFQSTSGSGTRHTYIRSASQPCCLPPLDSAVSTLDSGPQCLEQHIEMFWVSTFGAVCSTSMHKAGRHANASHRQGAIVILCQAEFSPAVPLIEKRVWGPAVNIKVSAPNGRSIRNEVDRLRKTATFEHCLPSKWACSVRASIEICIR